MKTLKEVMLGGYTPKSPDEQKFAGKHKVKETKDANGNDDRLFKAKNVKAVNRETPENHGYNPGTDAKVYESTIKEWEDDTDPTSPRAHRLKPKEDIVEPFKKHVSGPLMNKVKGIISRVSKASLPVKKGSA